MSWGEEYAVPKSVTKTDIAYLAGLLDGEGCLTIGRQLAGSGGRVNPSHRFYFKITIGQREVVEWLKEKFQAGSIHIQRHDRYNDGFNWWVASRQAIAILRVLRPYLKVKHVETDIAFVFAETYWQRGSSARLSKKVVTARERLYWKMREAKPSYRFRKNPGGSNNAKNSLHRKKVQK